MSSSGCPVLSEGLSHPTMTSSLSRTKNNPRIPKDPRGPQSLNILRMSPAVLNCMSSGSWTQNPQMNLRSQIKKVAATIRPNNTEVIQLKCYSCNEVTDHEYIFTVPIGSRSRVHECVECNARSAPNDRNRP
jgi:hypothetical protein